MNNNPLIRILITVIIFMLTACGSDSSGNGNDNDSDGNTSLSLHWSKSFKDVSFGMSNAVQQTSDGGYIVAGLLSNLNGPPSKLVLKLNVNGNIEWKKAYGDNYDYGFSTDIKQTDDGGYISTGSFMSSLKGGSDFWVIKYDTIGNILWQRSYGWNFREEAQSIQQTNDDGYIIAGRTDSAGVHSLLIVKINAVGDIVWQKTYANSGDTYTIEQTSDGGFIVAGSSYNYGIVGGDILVLKLDSTGVIEWQKAYGSTAEEKAFSVDLTLDGGYIVAGVSIHNLGTAAVDCLVIKLDSNGIIQWQKKYEGTANDYAYSIQQTRDGGYVFAGATYSLGSHYDCWIVKLDFNGFIMWQRKYGGDDWDGCYSIRQTNDGGFIASGERTINAPYDYDAWFLRLKSDGTISSNAPAGSGDITSAQVNDADLISNEISVVSASSTATMADTSVVSQDCNVAIETHASD